ncbi:MAG TPA: EamA family transporter [Pilimelia sp.]|nr:EamA family transporter [Pilimelia sp.]
MTAQALRPGSLGRTGPGVLMVLGSCVSVQVGAAMAARLFPATGAAGATFLRLVLAAAVLVAAVRPAVRGWTAAQWRSVVLFGLTLAGMNSFFYAALARIPLGIAVTIEFLGPLTLAAVLSRRARDAGWVLLAAAGVAALGLAGDGGPAGALDPLGVAFALAAAVFWALYILASARAGAAVAGQAGLAVAMAVAALVLLPTGLAGAGHATAEPRLILLALGTGLLASVIPYSLELSALRRLPRAVFGVLLSLEPATATLAGWLLLGQEVGPVTVAGIAVVAAASVGSTATAAARGGPRGGDGGPGEEPASAPGARPAP